MVGHACLGSSAGGWSLQEDLCMLSIYSFLGLGALGAMAVQQSTAWLPKIFPEPPPAQSLCQSLRKRAAQAGVQPYGIPLQAGGYKHIHCSPKQGLAHSPTKKKKKAGIKSMNETLWVSAVGIWLLQLWWKELVLWGRDIGVDAYASCAHIFHLENVCEDMVCCTVWLAQEGETDGDSF